MKFVKMHGCGNSYIYMDVRGRNLSDEDLGTLSEKVADKNKGIGSDGLIVLDDSQVADGRMRMYNADGSEGAMCGNGIRCLAKLMYERAGIRKDELAIETKSGIKTVKVVLENGIVTGATVDMGCPEFMAAHIPVITENGEAEFVNQPVSVRNGDGAAENFTVTCVSMGNPHAVTFVDAICRDDFSVIGPKFENHTIFPDRINTEFVKIIDRSHVKMRVWERGSGETMACGTGACATVAAGVKTGRLDARVAVEMTGGTLSLFYDTETNRMFMTGEAVEICEGELLF